LESKLNHCNKKMEIVTIQNLKGFYQGSGMIWLEEWMFDGLFIKFFLFKIKK
jgi:hypothetical protein